MGGTRGARAEKGAQGISTIVSLKIKEQPFTSALAPFKIIHEGIRDRLNEINLASQALIATSYIICIGIANSCRIRMEFACSTRKSCALTG